MTRAQVIAFKNHILSNNDYFANGYAIVYKDEEGRVIAYDNAPTPVMPNDTLGNYFYLRYDGDNRLVAKQTERLTDCGASRILFEDTLTVQLVAVVADAAELTLRNNLINTAMAYTGIIAIPTLANLNREQVVLAELKGMEADNIQAALQRLGNWTIIRLTLNLIDQYTPTDCIDEPCKNCDN